jgi:hypothetical protein
VNACVVLSLLSAGANDCSLSKVATMWLQSSCIWGNMCTLHRLAISGSIHGNWRWFQPAPRATRCLRVAQTTVHSICSSPMPHIISAHQTALHRTWSPIPAYAAKLLLLLLLHPYPQRGTLIEAPRDLLSFVGREPNVQR